MAWLICVIILLVVVATRVSCGKTNLVLSRGLLSLVVVGAVLIVPSSTGWAQVRLPAAISSAVESKSSFASGQAGHKCDYDAGLQRTAAVAEVDWAETVERKGAAATSRLGPRRLSPPSHSVVATKTFAAVDTPYGAATQATDAASAAARGQVAGGARVYRIGTLGKSAGPEAQFWSLEHPSTPGFAQRYGIPAENVANADFIESAVVKPGTNFVTRPAPGVGTNQGGGIEVVVPSGGVRMCGFSYTGPKGC